MRIVHGAHNMTFFSALDEKDIFGLTVCYDFKQLVIELLTRTKRTNGWF
jgi:hypothetical protein